MGRRTIAYVTGTRADFGLMTPVLEAIAGSPKLKLRLYATGMHLMPKFGRTIEEVRKQFPSVQPVPAIFRSDEKESMARFCADLQPRLVTILNKDKPDLLLTLGDRPEMLCAAVTALYLGIPCGHVHGGERSLTVDGVARHAITKLSHLHFAATEESAERILKMGEEPWRVHVTGAPALDYIARLRFPSRRELLRGLNINPRQKFILLIQHPVSEELPRAAAQMRETVAAVKSFRLPVVVVYPNADAGGLAIIRVIDQERANPLFRIFPNIPYSTFLALEKEAAVFVGNSSAAMIESASFKTPVVNIGSRQQGRQHGDNVINAGYDRRAIASAIKKSLFDRRYRARLRRVKNPWGDGHASKRIVKVLETTPFDARLLTKYITY